MHDSPLIFYAHRSAVTTFDFVFGQPRILGHSRAGAMPVVLDNLTADGAMGPVIAIFIEPRDPESGQNRREAEFLSNG